ncbi:unnamed protein product, partial [Iphiclides podalirius]
MTQNATAMAMAIHRPAAADPTWLTIISIFILLGLLCWKATQKLLKVHESLRITKQGRDYLAFWGVW